MERVLPAGPSGDQAPCPQTEFYPQFGNAKLESGSNAVSVYITSSYGEGAIGYDEYAYALNAHWPVVAMENPAGYYVLPSASNVAVALTQAQINEDPSSPNFLQQNLDSVYTYTDPRSYPLSSYSYLIVPQTAPRRRRSSAPPSAGRCRTYIDFYLCQGQQQAGGARLLAAAAQPRQGAFLQVNKIPGDGRGAEHRQLRHLQQPDVHQRQGHPAVDAPYPTSARRSARRWTAHPASAARRRRRAPRTPKPGATAGRTDGHPGRRRGHRDRGRHRHGTGTDRRHGDRGQAASGGSGGTTAAEHGHHRVGGHRAWQRRRRHPARGDHRARAWPPPSPRRPRSRSYLRRRRAR